ncbi:MAG: flagellar export chaperone FlgN [Candidatus Binatia bacterium]
MATFTELIAVLEGEVELGETLLLNLAAQKEAILAWDSATLLLHVEKKEQLVRLLTGLEEQRLQIARQLLHEHGLPEAADIPALKVLLAQSPPTPQTAALGYLQQRTWRIYSQLRAGEKHLTSLMGILLNHIGEALDSLAPPPPLSVYGGNGALALVRPEPGIVRGKA